MEEYIQKARKLLKDAGDDPDKLADAIKEICRLLIHCDPLKSSQGIDCLAKEFRIKKRLFDLAMQEAKRKIADDDKSNIDDFLKIIRVEKYLREKYDFYYNVVSNKLMYKEKDESMFSEMNMDNIYCDLKKHHLNYSMADLKSLMRSDFVPKRNAFVEYFESLQWDGNDDIGSLAKYIEVEETSPNSNEKERFKRMFIKMLVRMVACSIKGEVNKQCFTLVHEKQNSGKTTFLRWLCPPDLLHYYTENIGNSKDDQIALTENFIVNLDELASLSKYDNNHLKKTITTDIVKLRLPYGERTVTLQRRCSFVASTNRLEFLDDETGSVRWICFLLRRINWAYKDDFVINNIWAQAYHLLQSGNFEYQLSYDEIEENEKANKTFLIRTPEMELIQRYLNPRTKKEYINQGKKGPIRFMTSTNIMSLIQQKESGCIKLTAQNIGKSLNLLGFVKGSLYIPNNQWGIKGYFVEEKSEEADDVFQSLSDSLHDNDIENGNACQSGFPY